MPFFEYSIIRRFDWLRTFVQIPHLQDSLISNESLFQQRLRAEEFLIDGSENWVEGDLQHPERMNNHILKMKASDDMLLT
jgi:hypothetical protein